MKLHITTTRRALLAAATLALATASHAAVVTWGAATNITPGLAGDLNVSTAGTFVGALDFGNPASNTTVNGVTFTGINPGTIPGNSFTAAGFTLTTAATNFTNGGGPTGSAPFSNLSAPYQSLLSGILGSNSIPGAMTLTMNNLVAGATYQFQWWNNNSINFGVGTTSATAGNAVSLNANPSNTLGGLGQFAVGTFVADGTLSQAIAFANTTANTGNLLNGFQLRQLAPAPSAVPEPGSALAGMLALGACAGGLFRRNRRDAVQA